MPAWGDIVNSLLLNRQKLEQGQLDMVDTAVNIATKQEALATQQRLRSEFMGGALAPTPPGEGASTDFGGALDMNDPLMVSYKAATQEMATNKDKANKFLRAGAWQRAGEYDQIIERSQANLREIVTKIYDKQKEKFKEAAQVMQGVNDKNSLVTGVDYLMRNFPPGIAQKVLSGISFDANDGLPIYDASAARAIKTLQDQFKSGHEKTEEGQAVANETGRTNRADQVHKDKVMHEGQANARAANAQAGANARYALSYNAKDDKTAIQSEKDANNDLNKNELVKNFPKYAQAFSAAKNVERQMTSGGIRDTASPDIQNMVRGYEQSINNFRSFMGGKWTAQQTDRMQGALQNVRTYFKTIGEGKKPDQEIVRQIAHEVARVYQDTNASVLKSTLELRERTWKKRGDPMAVTSPAQMSEAVRTGRADIITDPETNQQMMAFRQPEDYGKDAKKQAIKKPLPENIVPIYDKQKEDKRKVGLRNGKLVLEESEEVE